MYDAVQSSYGNKKSKQSIESKGFKFDKSLSNGNQQVYYNPTNKQMLFNVAGTHNLSDWGTDMYLALGKLKDTNRYKEAKNTLAKAKQKYNPTNTAVTGHSLGGTISQYVANKNDKVFTLDKGATIGQKIRKNENAFRTSGDAVSLLNSNSKRMTTLSNPNMRTSILPLDILNSHSSENIKKSGINIDFN